MVSAGKDSPVSIATNRLSLGDTSDDPQARARELVALWYAHWGECERLNDLPLDPQWLMPWSDDVALFELVDHGADFRLQQIGEKLEAFFGLDCTTTDVSEFPAAYRQRLRQVLLRAAMIRAPAAEHYDWLVDGWVRSCIVCAMPVAGGLYQPTQLLLGVFYRTLPFGQAAADRAAAPLVANDLVRVAPSTDFPRASPPPSLSRRSASAADP